MSDLYTSPSEARRETAQIGKTGNFLQDWYTDRVRDGITYNPETGEYNKTGLAFWGGLAGMNDSNTITQIEKGKDSIREGEKIEAVLDRFPGVTDEQLLEASGGKGLTAGNVKGVVSEAVRTRQEKPTPLQTAQLDQQTEVLRQSGENQRATNARLLKQGEDAHKIALLTLQQNSQNSINQLEYQKIRDRQEDQRYNERMEQLDRKDRRSAIQSMVSGIAALGAAFAM